MSKLLSQGGFGCVYYPGIKCDGKMDPRTNVVTKLQKRDFNAYNEIKIGEMIKKIQHYKLFFLPVIGNCPVNLRSLDKSIISKCDVIADSDELKYTLMTIPYISNSSFFSILIGNSNDAKHMNKGDKKHMNKGDKKHNLEKKHMFLSLTETFKYLLGGIEKLVDNKIVHFDLKAGNILYNTITTDPQIIDFGISIPIDELNDSNLKDYFYADGSDYYVWPLEVQVINFIVNETKGRLTEKDAEKIAKEYTESNKGLQVFSKEFIDLYRKSCVNEIKKYVGEERKKVIYKLIEFYKTWDNYSLSILYLKTFEYIFSKGFERNSLIILFSQILATNINPDPSKRLSINETREKFNEIFYVDENVKDYIELIENFDYDVNLTTKKINEDLKQLNKTKREHMKR